MRPTRRDTHNVLSAIGMYEDTATSLGAAALRCHGHPIAKRVHER